MLIGHFVSLGAIHRGFRDLKVERTSQLTRGTSLSNSNPPEQYKVESRSWSSFMSTKVICGWEERKVGHFTRYETEDKARCQPG